jgi:hypothetical protein
MSFATTTSYTTTGGKMNFKFGKRKAQFGKPNFNYKNEKTKNERLRWLTVPIEHKITLKEFDMVAPLNVGTLSSVLYDKAGNRNSHVVLEIPIDRNPETLAISFFDNPDAVAIEIEGAKATNIKVIAGDTKTEIVLKYKLKFDLPTDRDKRSRLINCMGEEIHLSLKNQQQEAFVENDGDDDAQADLDKNEKAAKDKASKDKPAKGGETVSVQ